MRPVLVTAGATRNPIDATRYLSAGSTGSTGLQLACALAGGTHLLASPEAALRHDNAVLRSVVGADQLTVEGYGSTRDLAARMERWVRAHPAGIVVHAAAVGDYEQDADPAAPPRKIPSGQAALALALRPAPKILDQIRGWSAQATIVSFKAAPPGSTPADLSRIAEAQRRRTDSLLVFANTLGRLEAELVIQDAQGPTRHATRGAALADLAARLAALR